MPTSGPSQALFPTWTTFVIFITYISLFVNQGLLVAASEKYNYSNYNSTIVVLCTEISKLVLCILIQLSKYNNWSVGKLFRDITQSSKLLYLYLVPSFLYCLYNNLMFTNLKLFDLATYYCLMQFRIVLTAVIYQVLFKRKLNFIQWTALIVLTFGCLIKQYGFFTKFAGSNSITTPIPSVHNSNESITAKHNQTTTISNDIYEAKSTNLVEFLLSTSLLLFQLFCSCFAGVYNEYLLKNPISQSPSSSSSDVIFQNIFMYFDSILCNVAFYFIVPTSNHDESHNHIITDHRNHKQIYETTIAPKQDANVSTLTNPFVWAIIFNYTLSGLVASFFLSSLNSILKTFASALELFGVAFLGWLILNQPIDNFTIVALILVSGSLTIYSRSPVSTAPPENNSSSDMRGEFALLPTTED